MVEVKIVYGCLKPDLKTFSGISESRLGFSCVTEALEFAEGVLFNAIPVRVTEREFDKEKNQFYDYETVGTYKLEISGDETRTKQLLKEIVEERRIEDMCAKTEVKIMDFSGTEIGTIEDDVEDI